MSRKMIDSKSGIIVTRRQILKQERKSARRELELFLESKEGEVQSVPTFEKFGNRDNGRRFLKHVCHVLDSNHGVLNNICLTKVSDLTDEENTLTLEQVKTWLHNLTVSGIRNILIYYENVRQAYKLRRILLLLGIRPSSDEDLPNHLLVRVC